MRREVRGGHDSSGLLHHVRDGLGNRTSIIGVLAPLGDRVKGARQTGIAKDLACMGRTAVDQQRLSALGGP